MVLGYAKLIGLGCCVWMDSARQLDLATSIVVVRVWDNRIVDILF